MSPFFLLKAHSLQEILGCLLPIWPIHHWMVKKKTKKPSLQEVTTKGPAEGKMESLMSGSDIIRKAAKDIAAETRYHPTRHRLTGLRIVNR